MTYPQLGFMNSPEWMMMQNMMRSSQGSMPFSGIYSPYFTGAYPNFVGNATVNPTTPQVIAKPQMTQSQKVELIDKKLVEAMEQQNKLKDVVFVQDGMSVGQVNREAYDAEHEYLAEDGKNDGIISLGSALANMGKGCVKLFTGMFLDDKGELDVTKSLISLGSMVALGAVSMAFPIVGIGLLGVGLVAGAGTAVVGGIQAATAETDREAEEAFQNVGSGTLTAVLSAVGLKSVGGSINPITSFKNAFSQEWASLMSSPKTYLQDGWNSLKVMADKQFCNLFKKSHYESKYNKQVEMMQANADNATSNLNKQKWEQLKSLYEGIYKAADDDALRIAQENMNNFTSGLKNKLDFLRSTNNPANADEIARLEEMMRLANSVVPKNARIMSKIPKGSNVANLSDDALNDEINKLNALKNPTNANDPNNQQIDDAIRCLKSVYEAKNIDEQNLALESLDLVKGRLIQALEATQTNGATEAEVKVILDLLKLQDKSVVSKIINARNQKILALLEKYNTSVAGSQEQASAIVELGKYGLSSADDVDIYMSTMGEKVGWLKGTGNWFKKWWNLGKKSLGFVKQQSKEPQFITTSRVVDWANSQDKYGIKLVDNPELTQLQKANSDLISQLNHMRYELSCGRNVDVSTLA